MLCIKDYKHFSCKLFLILENYALLHRSNVLTLSQEKFASHVVEKSLKHASPKVLHCLMSEIFDGYVKDE